MTARHQMRVGGRRLGRDRDGPIDATPAPPLGEMLRAAREHKGVDIYRAERDTKIRAKYLEALEGGDYGSLPGAVYTKGFLRNYASYLGLDPDEVIERWRAETNTGDRNEAVTVAPPRPIAEPNRGLTFSRNTIVAVVLTLVVLAFAGYVVLQVFRFQSPTPLSITGPQVATLAADATTDTLSGTALAGATVSVTGPENYTGTAVADASGHWSLEVPVTKGENDFDVVATDPDTKRDSPTARVILTVPLPATPTPIASALPSGSPGPTATAVGTVNLAVTAPADGSSVVEGPVTVSGTTDGTSVVISATFLQPDTVVPTASPSASASTSPEPTPSPSPSPSPSEAPSAAPSPTVAPVTATVANGSFSQTITLSHGRWSISVTASASGHPDAVATRTIDVSYDGVTVIVQVRGGGSWIYGLQDGIKSHNTGHAFVDGDSAVLRGQETVEVDTSFSQYTFFTVDGQSLGSLGSGDQKWVFAKGQPPRQP